MSIPGSYQTIISANGITIQGGESVFAARQGIEPVDTTIGAGKTVTDWVKTDANTAACNLPALHGYSSGKFDVFWDGGRRYNVDGTVNVNALALDGGAGDDFPESATAGIVVCVPTTLDVTFDGDNLVLIGALLSRNGLLIFWDAGGAVIGEPIPLAALLPWGWATGFGTNPLAGNAVDHATVSNGSADAAASFKLTGLQYAA